MESQNTLKEIKTTYQDLATKKFKQPQISIPPIRKADRSWAKSDSEKAEIFGEHLSQVFITHDSNNHHNDDEIEKFLDEPCQMSLPIKAFSPKLKK
jgi:hypothetical protein